MKIRKLEKGELGFVAALGIFAIFCLIASIKVFVATPTLTGDGTVPVLTSIVMLAMVFLMLVEVRHNPRGFEKGTALGQKASDLVHFIFPGYVGLIVIYCIIYAVILKFAGFAVSTLAFLVASMLTLNREQKVRTFIISIVTLVCIMILFQFIFKVRLP